MNSTPVTLPGVAKSVTIENSIWSGLKFSIDGEVIKPHGFPPTKVTLPGRVEPVEVTVKGGLLSAHPIMVVGDQEFPTGPPTPRLLQVLTLLPLVCLVIVQGVLGFVVAFAAVAINLGLLRTENSEGRKMAIMGGVLAGAIVIDLILLAVT